MSTKASKTRNVAKKSSGVQLLTLFFNISKIFAKMEKILIERPVKLHFFFVATAGFAVGNNKVHIPTTVSLNEMKIVERRIMAF